jgi:hypothetical protein
MVTYAAFTLGVTMYTPYRKTLAVCTDSKAFFLTHDSIYFLQKLTSSWVLVAGNQPRCRTRWITRRALVDPFSSPFLILYNSQCTQSMITYTGFDYESFNSLLLLFTPYFEEFTPYSINGGIVKMRRGKGRKRMISPIICLGLVLAWTRTRGTFFRCSWTSG